ncbi:MAG: HypC/HybG/HupF family hydrogenase formation chaperone [Piscinibacter sp.]|nr:HypC/HybG/HupF family hydrogenase formation chaperone [Piscinibacter sp.]
MCIALPMQVFASEPGHAWVAGRGERRRVSTALVGDCAVGDWLLVFLDSARERIDAARAAEVDALLDLVSDALAGRPPAAVPRDPGFELPSRLDPAALAALAGPSSSA